MELKKTAKADLENKKGLFLEIGLVVAVGLCILMFSYSESEKVYEKMTVGTTAVAEEIVEITRQDVKPPEPVKATTVNITSDILDIVKNDTKVTTNFDFSSEFNEEEIIVAKPKVKEETVKEDTPFFKVETMPTFQGGDINGFRTWVQSKLTYPRIAEENGIQGKVTLSFIIEKDGSLTQIEIMGSPDKSLSDEAIKVVSTSPKWTPGKNRGVPARVKYILPVDFKLN